MSAPSPTCNACGAWWRLPLLLALVLAAVWLMRNQDSPQSTPAAGEASRATPTTPPGQTVSLTIDFGDGRREQLPPVAWRAGLTVEHLTRETLRRDLEPHTIGTGESTFLTSIGGAENEGGDGRNWSYSVNGKAGDRSFAVYELTAGDQVLWTFGKKQ